MTTKYNMLCISTSLWVHAWPAFGCCPHSKASQNTFLSCFQLFLILHIFWCVYGRFGYHDEIFCSQDWFERDNLNKDSKLIYICVLNIKKQKKLVEIHSNSITFFQISEWLSIFWNQKFWNQNHFMFDLFLLF